MWHGELVNTLGVVETFEFVYSTMKDGLKNIISDVEAETLAKIVNENMKSFELIHNFKHI